MTTLTLVKAIFLPLPDARMAKSPFASNRGGKLCHLLKMHLLNPGHHP